MAYRVKAPLATYRVAGQLLYGYEGAVLPDGVDRAEVEHLLDAGLIEEVGSDEQDGPPAKSASKGDWESFARSQGATDVDLEGMTKDDLVAAYGS